MKKKTFKKILQTNFEDLSYKSDLKSDVKCFHVISNNENLQSFRVYHFYNMKGLLNEQISLELQFYWNDKTKDVEMIFCKDNLKKKELMILSLLSEKAKELMRSEVLNVLEYYMEHKRSYYTCAFKDVFCLED